MYTRLQTTAPRQGGNDELACDDRVAPGITELAACGWRPRSEEEQSANVCECTLRVHLSHPASTTAPDGSTRKDESADQPAVVPAGLSQVRARRSGPVAHHGALSERGSSTQATGFPFTETDAGSPLVSIRPALTQIPAEGGALAASTTPSNRSPNASSGYENQRDSRESTGTFSNFQSRVGRAGVHEDATRSGESLARTEPEFAPVGCSELRKGVRGDAARLGGRSNARSASPGTVAYGSGGVDGDTQSPRSISRGAGFADGRRRTRVSGSDTGDADAGRSERPRSLPIRNNARQALARHGIDRDTLPDDVTVAEAIGVIQLRRAAMRMQ